ncbi:Phospholipase D beta 1, partial [Bienertia sinuspersici]
IPDIIGQQDAETHIDEDDIESWHVQVFRSIDSNSVKGFPKDPKNAVLYNGVCVTTESFLREKCIDRHEHTYSIRTCNSLGTTFYLHCPLRTNIFWAPHIIGILIEASYKTTQLMYQIIYKALEEKGMENTYEPQDYLNFFCLGNHELPDRDSNDNVSSGSVNTPQTLLKRSRRFMVYVHSKGMIVDDEYVIWVQQT